MMFTFHSATATTAVHTCTTTCPTGCGVGLWDDQRGYAHVSGDGQGWYSAPTRTEPTLLVLKPRKLPWYPETVRAPLASPMRGFGVGLGMRWREYQTRR